MDQPEVFRLMALLPDFKSGDANLKTLESVTYWPHAISPELTMEVEANPKLVSRLIDKISVQKPFVLLAPGSQWLTKRWTASGYAALADWWRDRGFHVYLVGSTTEKTTCEDVLRSSNQNSKFELRSLAGETDLYELHALMSVSEFVVANDSGSMHMATAAGVPVVGIFGPTVLAQGYRPWSNRSAVAQIPVPCRPCGRHGHKKCPVKTHECMKTLTVETVTGVISQLKGE